MEHGSLHLGCDPKFVLILILLFVMVAGESVLRKPRPDGPRLGELVLIGALSAYPALLVVLARLSGSA